MGWKGGPRPRVRGSSRRTLVQEMSRKPPPPPPPPPPGEPSVGASGLPNLATFDAEVTSTRNTETSLRTAPPSTRSARPTLTVLSGFDAGKVVVISNDMVLGRASTCALSLSDPGVSRVHARIVRRGDDLVIYDAGSKNGTYVGDVASRPEGHVLAAHDVIHLGPHVSVRFARMARAEEKLARDLFESSMRDPLTRAYNRRYLANRLKAEVAYVARHGGALSVITFDFDHFKKLNDSHGHAAGDAVLRGGAAVVVATLRSEDLLARVGGEEFVVVLRGIARDAASACAERIRAALEQAEFLDAGGSLRVTVSVGVATSDEVVVDPGGKALIKLADERLYEAKATGRNRVVDSMSGRRPDPSGT